MTVRAVRDGNGNLIEVKAHPLGGWIGLTDQHGTHALDTQQAHRLAVALLGACEELLGDGDEGTQIVGTSGGAS